MGLMCVGTFILALFGLLALSTNGDQQHTSRGLLGSLANGGKGGKKGKGVVEVHCLLPKRARKMEKERNDGIRKSTIDGKVEVKSIIMGEQMRKALNRGKTVKEEKEKDGNGKKRKRSGGSSLLVAKKST